MEVLKECTLWVNKKEYSLPKGGDGRWYDCVDTKLYVQYKYKVDFFFFFVDKVYKEELTTPLRYLAWVWCIGGNFNVRRWSYEKSRCDYDSSIWIKEHGNWFGVLHIWCRKR